MEVDWASGDLYDPPSGAPGSEDVPFAGCFSIDSFAMLALSTPLFSPLYLQ